MKYLRLIVLVFLTVVLFNPQAAQAFSDLPETHHHHFPLSYLEHEGVIQGYSDGTVRPDNSINRAELIKILVEGLNHQTNSQIHKNCFPDVKTEWFAKYVCYAKEKNWIGGYPDGTFKPGQTVNKVEALKIIMNAFGINERDTSRQLFSDTPKDDWYIPYLNIALQKNIIEETSGVFNPSYFRSRAEVSLMVARIMQIQYMGDPSYTDWIEAEFKTYLLLHKLRRENGVMEKLKLNPNLTKVARLHSEDMAENIGDMSHASSDGVTQSFDRIKAIIKEKEDPNFSGRTGENVGRHSVWSGYPLINAIKAVHDNIFMPEPDNVCNHRTTILSQCLPYTEVGIGVHVKDDKLYFTQDFITREYVDAITDLSVLAVPSEYTNNPLYQVEQGSDYTLTSASSCSNVSIRAAYYIDVGIYMKSGNCGIYEYAWSTTPDYDLTDKFYSDQIFSIEYTSTYYTSSPPTANSPFMAIRAQASNGWSIVDHDNPNLPAYYDIGEVIEVSFTDGSQTFNFRLDFGVEGWTTITKI